MQYVLLGTFHTLVLKHRQETVAQMRKSTVSRSLPPTTKHCSQQREGPVSRQKQRGDTAGLRWDRKPQDISKVTHQPGTLPSSYLKSTQGTSELRATGFSPANTELTRESRAYRVLPGAHLKESGNTVNSTPGRGEAMC